MLNDCLLVRVHMTNVGLNVANFVLVRRLAIVFVLCSCSLSFCALEIHKKGKSYMASFAVQKKL